MHSKLLFFLYFNYTHIVLGNLRPTQATAQEAVGRAEVYKFRLASALAGPGLVGPTGPLGPVGPAGLAAVPTAVPAIAMPPGAPLWLQPLFGAVNAIQVTVNNIQVTVDNIQVTVDNIQVTVDNIQADIIRMQTEQPILLFNSRAGTEGLLYDPTAPPGQWVHLVAPNPTTRDVLFQFTGECNSVVNTILPIPLLAPQCIASAAALGLPLLPANTTVMQRRRQIGNKIGVKI